MTLRQIAGALGMVGALALARAPAAGKPAPEARKARSLAGQLLVATPAIGDPRFSGAVIYMVQHDQSGALGLIVNRPLEEVPIALLLERLGQEHGGVKGTLRMHYGGPVELGRVFVLHTSEYRGEGTLVVAGGIAVTGTAAILRAIGSGSGPRRALLVVSYSGWGPGQLEGEIRAGGWFAAPPEHGLVFDDRYATKWERALALRELEL